MFVRGGVASTPAAPTNSSTPATPRRLPTARASNPLSQAQPTPQRRKRTQPRPPKGTAPHLKPSIRRRLSQVELVKSPEVDRGFERFKIKAAKRPSLLTAPKATKRGRVSEVAPEAAPPRKQASKRNAVLSTTSQSSEQVQAGSAAQTQAVQDPSPPMTRTRSGRAVKPSAKLRGAAQEV
jgi:hypothetical protein